MRSNIEKDLEVLLKTYEDIRSYLESGGDVTYAYLNLAKLDLEIASKYIQDDYCRKQVVKELRALEIALTFAMLANEWKLGLYGLTGKLKLVGRAIIEILKLAFVHFSRI